MKSKKSFEGQRSLPLTSYLVSLAFCCLLFGGCATSSAIETGRAHPSLEIDSKGFKCNGEPVSPWDVPEILEDHGIAHDTTIYIRVNQMDDPRTAQKFRVLLARAGYSRTVLVTKEHAEAWTNDSRKGAAEAPLRPKPRPTVRYRSANED